jgi:hypothetical protein
MKVTTAARKKEALSPSQTLKFIQYNAPSILEHHNLEGKLNCSSPSDHKISRINMHAVEISVIPHVTPGFCHY